MKHHVLLRAVLAVVAIALSPLALAATDIPCRTAKLIVPWKPGGGTDVIFRIFANSI